MKFQNALKDFYDGAFRIAIETKTPVKPVLFLDAYDRLHYNSFLSLSPGISRSVFLDEISVEELTLKNVQMLKQKTYDIMEEALQRYRESMDALDLRAGADAIWELVSKANLYVQQSAPWSLAKTGKESELDDVLGSLARGLTRLAILASPFIPSKSQALWEMLGFGGEVGTAGWAAAEQPAVSGRTVSRAEVLFPKPASV